MAASINFLSVDAQLPLTAGAEGVDYKSSEGFKKAKAVLVPAFASGTTAYSVEVPAGTSHINVMATSFSRAVVKINGQPGNMALVALGPIAITLEEGGAVVGAYTLSPKVLATGAHDAEVIMHEKAPVVSADAAAAAPQSHGHAHAQPHAHSHGGVACTADHGAAAPAPAPEKHAHSHGGVACTEDHKEEHQHHGHGHGAAKEPVKIVHPEDIAGDDGAPRHAQSHGHAHAQPHAHSHGGVACTEEHKEEEKKEEHHGHAHHAHGHGH
eukprot:CAMPEP_0197617012 /NCGR_PEP_ID=MMETSP1326-20131121/60820_1 /TAXON_ID=1155430 /ORGANISM="Genus nov. species nov., Strain RCC2288" /LENGTH=267 /DNA_ID=CAMNT_0043185901 /DNA_START=49 /DNA_END=853 /DNA_ORIENTATION=-